VRAPILILVSLLTLVLHSCKTSFTGEVNPNKEPETFLVADTIIRVDGDRLNSQVEIRWWGDDPDGYVVGYEFSFDSIITSSTQWQFTAKQDSTFLLAAPPGQDTVDFPFFIRAIDNSGAADATPAHLIFPVKNSPPAVTFVYTENNPVKSFPVLRFFWEGNDPDGITNLRRYEICWNDTLQPPYLLDVTASGAVFEGINLQAAQTDCRVYVNNNTAAEQLNMSGLLLNSNNVLYIRAVDNAEAASPYTASAVVFVKKVSSEILMVDGYSANGGPVEGFYTQQLTAAGFAVVDTLQIFAKENNAYSQQSADNFTQSKIFALFNGIVWFTNDASGSLSIGQRTLNEFFNKGGKLLMSVYVSSLFDEQSGFLDFTPIQSFVVPQDTTLLLTDTAKVFSQQSGFPDLKSTAYVGVVRPFVPVVGAEIVYDAQLIAKDNNTLSLSEWQGGSTVMASKKDAAGETNFIISTLELHKLDGMANMNVFFNEVMHTEFGF
jgi:hypothetical protein